MQLNKKLPAKAESIDGRQMVVGKTGLTHNDYWLSARPFDVQDFKEPDFNRIMWMPQHHTYNKDTGNHQNCNGNKSSYTEVQQLNYDVHSFQPLWVAVHTNRIVDMHIGCLRYDFSVVGLIIP